MLAVRLVLALATFGVIVALGRLVAADAVTRLAIVLFALAMILDAVTEGLTSFFFAFERMVYPSAAAILRAGAILAAVALCAYGGMGLGGVVGATAIGAGAATLAMTVAFAGQFFVPRLRLDLGFIRSMLRNAMPYVAMALITNIFFRIDMVMLSLMKGDLETGLYGAAYRIMESLLFISTAVNSAALPAMSRVLVAAPSEVGVIFRGSFRWLVWLGLPMTVGLTVLASPIMALFGEGFVAAASTLQVLAWAVLLMFVNHLSGTLLTAAGKQRMLVWICAVALILNVLLNLKFIPRYGRMGAAWVTFLCECGFLPALVFAARRYLDLRILVSGMWRPCLTAGAMGVFCWYFSDLPLAAVVPCGAAVYGLLLAASYLLRPEAAVTG
jgi:O-antigen/teichoic acid export membrane protein